MSQTMQSQTEDVFIFYKEELEPEFGFVWTNLAKSENFCDSHDVRIECSDGRYRHSHQSLLSISSQCFRDAIEYYYNNRLHELSPNEELVITLPYTVSYEDLDSIIHFIYNGIVYIPESRVNHFLDVSNFLAIKGLEDIKLLFLNEIDNFNDFLISKQIPNNSLSPKPKYQLKLNELQESEDWEEKYWSDNSSDSYTNTDSFTTIKEQSNEEMLKTNGSLKRNFMSNVDFMSTEMMSEFRRVGLQGRRPQIGSPMITEEFRFGDRYQCKVCLRSYLWKKSLVRHYKDLHPNDIQLVTE